VAAFLKCKITFLEIPRVVEQTLAAMNHSDPADLATVLALDAEARRVASERIA
jgi:1-deoxy-D-xylulose-5-phosphate reductoisomerase